MIGDKIKITQLDKADGLAIQKNIVLLDKNFPISHIRHFMTAEVMSSNVITFAVRRSEEIYRDFLIGAIYIDNIDWIARHCEIYFFIRTEDKNLNYVVIYRSIIKWVIDFIFDELNFNKISADTIDSSDIRIILEEFGFIPEGVRRELCFLDGKYVDTVYCSLLRSAYVK